jgi:cytochrome c
MISELKIFGLVVFTSMCAIAPRLCVAEESEKPRAAENPASTETDDAVVKSKELALFEKHCSTCHSLDRPRKLAVPMRVLVRKHKKDGKEKLAFRERVVSFVTSSQHDVTKYPDVLEQLGFAPPLTASSGEIGQVADYVWELYQAKVH